MPTYDYLCGACNDLVEIFHSMGDAPKRKCPSCGKLKLKRQIGAGAGIIFKGTGYYQTDYRSESYKKDAAADKPASEKSTKSDSSDSKPKADKKKSDASKSKKD